MFSWEMLSSDLHFRTIAQSSVRLSKCQEPNRRHKDHQLARKLCSDPGEIPWELQSGRGRDKDSRAAVADRGGKSGVLGRWRGKMGGKEGVELQLARLTHRPAGNPICSPNTVIFAEESLSSVVIFHGRLGKGLDSRAPGLNIHLCMKIRLLSGVR